MSSKTGEPNPATGNLATWQPAMNFLAHIFLSNKKPHLVVGNFLADFIKNKEVAMLPLPIQEGVRMHRQIDTFTDNHPMVKQGVLRLRPAHRKFAPVVLDICFDYILAKNWERYSDEGLHFFTKEMYAILEDHIHLMPIHLQKQLPRMIADDWLVKYGTKPGLRYTFERMKKRTKYPRFFENAVDNFLKTMRNTKRNSTCFFLI